MFLTIPEAQILTYALSSDFHDDDGTRLEQPIPLEAPPAIHMRLHLQLVKWERSLSRMPGTLPHPDIAIAETLEKKIIGITDETAKALYASVKLFWSNASDRGAVLFGKPNKTSSRFCSQNRYAPIGEDGFYHNHKLLRFVIAGLISSDEARQHVTKLAKNDASEEEYASRIIAFLDELDRLRNFIRKQHETRKPDDNLHQSH